LRLIAASPLCRPQSANFREPAKRSPLKEVSLVRSYIMRRLAVSIVVLIGISIIIYALVRSMPSDYVSMATSSSTKISEEQRNQLRAIYGLDKSIPAGYIDWLLQVARGNLGTSLVYARPVAEVIGKNMGITFTVALLSLFVELLLGIPLGILAAKRRNTTTDYIITAFVFIGISVPTFFLAALLKKWFGFGGLNWLPTAGMLNPRVIYKSFTYAKLIDYAKHLILPIAVFAITSCGVWLRYTRGSMIEALESDYVRTARAKGVPERVVVYSHAFRNTLIPIVTLIGASLPGLFSGAIITENLFGIQGLGNIAMKASQMSDVPYLMGFNMFLAICTIIGYLISDILYAVVDPRVRLS
jgi:peptide/nickel transport system permease protein